MPPKIYSFDGRNVLTDFSWYVSFAIPMPLIDFAALPVPLMSNLNSLVTWRPQKLVWHGADRLGVRNGDAYCDAWNSNSIAKVGLASSLIRGKLLDQEKYSCNNAFIVLCIEATTPDDRQKRHITARNDSSSTDDFWAHWTHTTALAVPSQAFRWRWGKAWSMESSLVVNESLRRPLASNSSHFELSYLIF